ncbi:SPRY domain-containing SOCS box protein 3-like isoform X2 [Acanthaster planci]|uniref:SPRY domain-containing SOCS box protein 3 n=1 Tax=Acanthaster planci TaxID=133434 RepID=A0A8B7YQ81_ACAPL|nr:SPRY domain-containing SOCS box protein 3-like isoform X2 [Acanthaster planci]
MILIHPCHLLYLKNHSILTQTITATISPPPFLFSCLILDAEEDSMGTAGVRGTQGFHEGEFYWEIIFTEPAFGTAVMVGVGTRKALLHTTNYQYINMLGMDDQSWGLSYKGTLWHNGTSQQYCQPFYENNTRIGILLNLYVGTLTFFKDGVNLGVAFKDLHHVGEDLYPLACSTAAETELELGVRSSRKLRLQDKCYSTILRHIGHNDNNIDILPLPHTMKHVLKVDRHNARL